MLNLKATTDNEKIILNYLTLNASDQLKEKINKGVKTLSQCWKYIETEARKVAVNGCACVQDATVFGWAIHFFEEDGIEAADKRVETVKAEPKPKKKTNIEASQINLFDILG